MKTIWKYELQPTDKQDIEMPVDATILDVQAQNGIPCIWALVNPEEQKHKKTIRVYGTGYPISDDPGRYIGTYQILSGDLVFHVFEE